MPNWFRASGHGFLSISQVFFGPLAVSSWSNLHGQTDVESRNARKPTPKVQRVPWRSQFKPSQGIDRGPRPQNLRSQEEKEEKLELPEQRKVTPVRHEDEFLKRERSLSASHVTIIGIEVLVHEKKLSYAEGKHEETSGCWWCKPDEYMEVDQNSIPSINLKKAASKVVCFFLPRFLSAKS